MPSYCTKILFGFICIPVVLSSICTSCKKSDNWDDPNDKIVVATMGASLMYYENGWVEQACKELGYECFNKAVSGETTLHFAQKIWRNEYAADDELDMIDVVLIQFANCHDVYGDSTTFYQTADEYTKNYTVQTDKPFYEYSHAQRIDYILKKWQQLCEQRHKPMHVIFVTHWHDGRVTYNESVRKLAQRWNTGVCEIDKNIGFTKYHPLPDGTQPSVLYATDTEFIDDIEYGWHPLRGDEGKDIQGRMADILENCLMNYVHQHHIE